MKNTSKYRALSAFCAILFFKAPFYPSYALTFCFALCVFILHSKESLNPLNSSFPAAGIFAGMAFPLAQYLLPKCGRRETTETPAAV
jgi:hypothetical protein